MSLPNIETKVLELEDRCDQMQAQIVALVEQNKHMREIVDVILLTDPGPTRDRQIADLRSAVDAADADTEPSHQWRDP